MKRILVDTDVLIDFTKGYSQILAALLAQQSQNILELHVTPVNIAEFFDNKELTQETKRNKAMEFLAFFRVCEITKPIGVYAGELLRTKKVSFLGDALIAAACVVGGFSLLTRNRRHFVPVPGLLLYSESSEKN